MPQFQTSQPAQNANNAATDPLSSHLLQHKMLDFIFSEMPLTLGRGSGFEPRTIPSHEAVSAFDHSAQGVKLSAAEKEDVLKQMKEFLHIDPSSKLELEVTGSRAGMSYVLRQDGKLFAQIDALGRDSVHSFTDFRNLRGTQHSEPVAPVLPIPASMQTADRIQNAVERYVGQYPSDFRIFGQTDVPNPLSSDVANAHIRNLKTLLGVPQDSELNVSASLHGLTIELSKDFRMLGEVDVRSDRNELRVRTYSAQASRDELRTTEGRETEAQREADQRTIPAQAQLKQTSPHSEYVLKQLTAYVAAHRDEILQHERLYPKARAQQQADLRGILGFGSQTDVGIEISLRDDGGASSVWIDASKNGERLSRATFKMSSTKDFDFSLDDRSPDNVRADVQKFNAAMFRANRNADEIATDSVRAIQSVLPILASMSDPTRQPKVEPGVATCVSNYLKRALGVPETASLDVHCFDSTKVEVTLQARDGLRCLAEIRTTSSPDESTRLYHASFSGYERAASIRPMSEQTQQELLRTLR